MLESRDLLWPLDRQAEDDNDDDGDDDDDGGGDEDDDDDGDGDEDENDDDDDNHWAVGQWESRSRGSPHLKIIIIKIIR